MSLIIAMKTKEGTVIAADRRISSRNGKIHKETTKVFEVNGVGIGICGMLTQTNLIMSSILSNRFTWVNDLKNLRSSNDRKDYLTLEVPKQIKRLFKDYDIKPEDEDYTIVIAVENDLFDVSYDCVVTRHNNYVVLGNPKDYARGYLDKTIKDNQSLKLASNRTTSDTYYILYETFESTSKVNWTIDNEVDFITIPYNTLISSEEVKNVNEESKE